MDGVGVTSSDLHHGADRIVHHIVDSKPVRTEMIREGVMTVKFAVETEQDGTFVVRFYPRVDTQVIAYEPDLVRRLKAAGLPAAHVVIDSRTGPSSPLPYMVYKMIPGTSLRRQLPLLEASARNKVARQVVDFLGKLHQLDVEGYGDLLSATAARFDSWLRFMDTSFAEGISAAQDHQSLPEALITGLKEIRQHLEFFNENEGGRSGLAWGDILTDNILVHDDGSLAGIVDFEGALAAESWLNLGYCYAACGPNGFFQDLKDAWSGSIAPVAFDRVELYAVLRGVRIAKFAQPPLPAGRPRAPLERTFPGFAIAVESLSSRLRGFGAAMG
jgi:aminoglycoside phosphotransferase (APT) family kinase protein